VAAVVGLALVAAAAPVGAATEEAKLSASDAAGGDNFGRSVSVSGDTAVVGSYLDDDAGSGSGSAYVFDVVPPDTFVTSGPPGVTTSSSATFDFVGTDSRTPSGHVDGGGPLGHRRVRGAGSRE